VRIPKSHKLPVVLQRDQVRLLIESTQLLHFRTFFHVCYVCGLRLGDAKRLQPGDIDAERGQVLIRNGKGGKDRIVPMPLATIELLRRFWKTHRNPHLMFPSRSDSKGIHATTEPMSDRGLQRAFQVVVIEQQFAKLGVRLHTLRHSYATHLLDEGVNLKVLQQYLGHKSLQTTEIYLHLTRQGDEQARRIVNGLLAESPPIMITGESTAPH
jgi:integrase